MTTKYRFDEGERSLAAKEMSDLFFGPEIEPVRHLAGKHDQKAHAGSRGSASGVGTVDDGPPEGWTMASGETSVTVMTRTGGAIIVAPLDSFAAGPPGYTPRSPEEQRRLAEDAAVATSRVVASTMSAYPELGDVALHVEISSRGYPTMGERTVGDTTQHRRGDGQLASISMRLRPGLYSEMPGDEYSWQFSESSLMAGRTGGARAEAMALSANPPGRGWSETRFHGTAARVDPVRQVVTHEMGHVLDMRRTSDRIASAFDPDDPVEWADVPTEGSSAVSRLVIAPGVSSATVYESSSAYAKTNANEFYAEGFAEWHMRDVAEPSAAAQWLAKDQGWEGS